MEETEYEKKKIEEMIHFLASKGYRKESICLASLGYEKYGIMKESSYFNEIRDDLSYAEALLQTNSESRYQIVDHLVESFDRFCGNPRLLFMDKAKFMWMKEIRPLAVVQIVLTFFQDKKQSVESIGEVFDKYGYTIGSISAKENSSSEAQMQFDVELHDLRRSLCSLVNDDQIATSSMFSDWPWNTFVEMMKDFIGYVGQQVLVNDFEKNEESFHSCQSLSKRLKINESPPKDYPFFSTNSSSSSQEETEFDSSQNSSTEFSEKIRRETSPPAKQRTKFKWTPREEQLVAEGVAKFGEGKWAEIKKEYFPDSFRSPTNIKDKYRNMIAVPIHA